MNTTPTQDLLTRVLASLKHLHTLHGPCDEDKCPHAAVITELEDVLFTESSPPLPECTCALYLWPHSLACPCHPQNLGRAMELIVGGKPWEMPSSPPLPHDPHDLASALIAAQASGATILTGVTDEEHAVMQVERRLFFDQATNRREWRDME